MLLLSLEAAEASGAETLVIDLAALLISLNGVCIFGCQLSDFILSKQDLHFFGSEMTTRAIEDKVLMRFIKSITGGPRCGVSSWSSFSKVVASKSLV